MDGFRVYVWDGNGGRGVRCGLRVFMQLRMYILGMWLEEDMVEIDIGALHTPRPLRVNTRAYPDTPSSTAKQTSSTWGHPHASTCSQDMLSSTFLQ